LQSYQLMGKGQEHFRCRVLELDGVAFNRADLLNPSLAYLNQDMVFALEENEFRGRKSIQLRLSDMRPSTVNLGDDANELGAGRFQSMMVFLRGQLELGQNIIMVFPTCRLLNKQKMLLRRYIQPEAIEELHGCMAYAWRSRTERRLQEQGIKICLTTQAYLNYYLRQRRLAEPGYHIISLWADPAGEKEQNVPGAHPHTRWHWVPGHHIEVQREWAIEKECRTYIYSNRPTTLRNLTQGFPGFYIEIGADSLEKRDSIRQSFLSRLSGTLVSDGAYAGVFNSQTIDEVVFADLPFSEYEALAVLSQIAADQDTRVCATFGRDAVDFNRNYLERSYPTEGMVSDVWRYLGQLGPKSIQTSAEALGRELKTELGRAVSPLEIEAALWILTDLGLCEIEKKGSIMAIKLTNTGAAEIDLSESPYYLEGLAEKKAFAAWVERLNEIYAW